MAFQQGTTTDLAASLPKVNSHITSKVAPTQPALRCTVCDKDGATLCFVCGSASYCSRSCEDEDARCHQTVCPDFRGFLSAESPREDAKLALFFSEASVGPKLVWVVERNRQLMEVRGSHTHTVVVCYRDNFFWDGKFANNLSIFNFTQGEHKHDWRGPIAVLSQRGTLNSSGYDDITLTDLRVFRDFLMHYGEGLEKSLQYGGLRCVELSDPGLWERMMLCFMPKDAKMVKGVKISCMGDIRILKRPQFAHIEVPPNHPIFFNEDEGKAADASASTQISAHMNLPLIIRRTALDLGWKGLYNTHEDLANNVGPINEPAALLTTIIDTESKLWGGNDVGPEYELESGTVLEVRQDKKDLTVEQVKALVGYIRDHIKPAIEKEKRRESSLDKKQILSGRESILETLVTMESVRKHFKAWGDHTSNE
ncbi:uncharacterized protein LY89DRAFT_752162 [Mollisia scopiformis]|uniref:MYND-type domain-containing protein n=1 Tax=Mollisia scopiformis TaxID=149040 RepID=A0A194X268_MOLSC|nr:uncharacterized protein LY89DRAFT_752162 [Mollisia scopiformis]KUJ14295.1 hypothetical protein LY89DRAFT_752162 [Mollisia scopiformis]